MPLTKYIRLPIVAFMLLLLSSHTSWAAQANFSWWPNNPADGTVGYMLHYGTSSREYTESVDVGSPTPIDGRVHGSIFHLVPEQTYFFTVTAYNADGVESPYPNEVTFAIPVDAVNNNLYDIYMSSSSRLSGAVALDGATVDGDIYVFTGPDTAVSRVTFSVDGEIAQIESAVPFELAGGRAFDTSQLSPGPHEITANIELSDGSSQLVSAVFNDSSVNTIFYDIFVSTSSRLSEAVTLDGATVDGSIYVFTGPDEGVSRVTFSVDGAVARTENVAPFELSGGAAFDASKLSSGQHEITANIELNGGGFQLVRSLFTIPSEDESSVNKGEYELFAATSSKFSGAVPLDGATVEGDIYIFTGPDTGVSRVTFSVDGVVACTENAVPFELAGGKAFDTSKLSSGDHEIAANIELSDGGTELVKAMFTIPSVNEIFHDIFVSKSSDFAGAIALENATVDGGIYVFTSPDTGVSRVTFSIDGVVARTEGYAPYELAGGAAFDTSQLSTGQHEIAASILLSDGRTELVSAVFDIPSVNNKPVNDSIYDLLVSESPYLSGAVSLEGNTVDGDIYVFTGPDTGVSLVTFSIDGVVARTERFAPYEFAGGAAFNTSQLTSGKHAITALIQLSDGSSELISATFNVL